MVRHADDHVHVVVCRVSDEGKVWHGRNDRRAEWEQIRKVVERDTPAPRRQSPKPQQQQRVTPPHSAEQVQHLRRPDSDREDRGRGL